jgi:glyoxylase-like metal-dependent hydrolase (beta-lactamase superfamily II)
MVFSGATGIAHPDVMNSISRRSFVATGTLATGLFAGASRLLASNNPPVSSLGSPHQICLTCGAQFSATDTEPDKCPICQDERQYVGAGGQQWTTLDRMRRGEWHNVIRELEPNLAGIGTEPKFAIGQRALLVGTPDGNVLWDCVSFLDDATIRTVKELGGISAIAISHPHYCSSMVEWSRAFGDVPIHLHEDDRQWVMRPDKRVRFWGGETKALSPGLTLIRTGGHFDGYQVLHWKNGAEGKGALLSGDQPQVTADPRWVSFMYSYPNFIPLNRPAIERIVSALEPFEYDRVYGAFWPSIVKTDGKAAVKRSADRYLRHIA